MAHENSVTSLLDGLKAGEGDVGQLWDRYFDRLVRLAAARLPRGARRTLDEEDVALSAFHSFCDRAGRGQFPRLDDRDDLWRVLAAITRRKVLGALRHESRAKRGGGRVFGESVLLDGDGNGDAGLAQFLGREPTPEEAATLADECDHLFARLDDPVLRQIARLRLDDWSSAEIAAELKVTRRTVDRKLRLIRALWEDADGEGGSE